MMPSLVEDFKTLYFRHGNGSKMQHKFVGGRGDSVISDPD